MNVNTEFSGNVKSQDGSRNVDWEVFFTGSWGHQSPGIDSQEAGLKHVLQGSVISVTGNGEGTFPDNVSGPCLKGDRLFEYGRIEIRFHIQGNKIVSTNSYQGGVLFPVVEISGTWSLERATIEVPRQGGEWSYYYTDVLPDPSRRSSLNECGQADPARWPLVASGTLTGKAGVTFPNQVHLALGGWQLSDFNWNGLVSVPAASGNAFPVTPSR